MSELKEPPVPRFILLVDDEPAIVALLNGILENANYQCHVALNGADALATFQQRRAEIDVVLTDFNMPLMNGFELVREIRAIRPEVKVILSSGSLGDNERAVADELKVNAILPKPWNSAQVLACVDAVFAQ